MRERLTLPALSVPLLLLVTSTAQAQDALDGPKDLGGFTWYRGLPQKSCNQVCSSLGLAYEPGGSGGWALERGHCELLGDTFLPGYTMGFAGACGAAIGCSTNPAVNGLTACNNFDPAVEFKAEASNRICSCAPSAEAPSAVAPSRDGCSRARWITVVVLVGDDSSTISTVVIPSFSAERVAQSLDIEFVLPDDGVVVWSLKSEEQKAQAFMMFDEKGYARPGELEVSAECR